MNEPAPAPPKKPSAGALVWGGLVPLIAFTVIENEYGTMWGLIAGLAFGAGEVIFELWRHRKVSAITWFGNGMLFALGAISLVTQDGVWFKLQPAILELVVGAAFAGSVFLKRNLLTWIVRMQGHPFPEPALPYVDGLCVRIGVFFIAQAVLATYAAFYWSTEMWVLLKGAGVLVFFVLYLLVEMIVLRRRLRPR